jgi:hypothetical protein
MKRARSVLNLALFVFAVYGIWYALAYFGYTVAAQSCYGGYCLCLVRVW